VDDVVMQNQLLNRVFSRLYVSSEVHRTHSVRMCLRPGPGPQRGG